ncbi:hypothetical protein WL24_00855 [Burkholderia ubonensis]|nr:hypothetical protein WL24_00855 [Burkholderia ubonensis]
MKISFLIHTIKWSIYYFRATHLGVVIMKVLQTITREKFITLWITPLQAQIYRPRRFLDGTL